jgi:hypothetical protein
MNNPTTSYLFQQLAYSAPQLIVYVLGIILAAIFIRKYPGPALLTLLATIILLVTTLGLALAQGSIMRLRFESGWTITQYSQVMSVLSIVASILRALGLAVLLAAVFFGRQSKTVIEASNP